MTHIYKKAAHRNASPLPQYNNLSYIMNKASHACIFMLTHACSMNIELQRYPLVHRLCLLHVPCD